MSLCTSVLLVLCAGTERVSMFPRPSLVTADGGFLAPTNRDTGLDRGTSLEGARRGKHQDLHQYGTANRVCATRLKAWQHAFVHVCWDRVPFPSGVYLIVSMVARHGHLVRALPSLVPFDGSCNAGGVPNLIFLRNCRSVVYAHCYGMCMRQECFCVPTAFPWLCHLDH